MAHHISRTQDGRDAMVYVGSSPWHRLGTELDPSDAHDLDLAVETAGLGFRVERRPRAAGEAPPAAAGRLRERPSEPRSSSGSFRVIRLDSGDELGEVTEDWHPLQNLEAFDPLRPALDSGIASIETAGVLRGGRQVWMLVNFDREHLLGRLRGRGSRGSMSSARMRLADLLFDEGGHGVRPYGLFYNDHSGARDAIVKQTAIRVVCANTLEWSLCRGRGPCRRVPHDSRIRGSYAAAAASLIEDLAVEFQALAEQRAILRSNELSEEAFTRLVLGPLAPIGSFEQRLYGRTGRPGMGQEASGEMERTLRLRTQIRELWEEGAGHRGDRSAWEAYNGAVQWLDHAGVDRLPRSLVRGDPPAGEARLESLIDGALARAKRQVFKALLAHASAPSPGPTPGPVHLRTGRSLAPALG